ARLAAPINRTAPNSRTAPRSRCPEKSSDCGGHPDGSGRGLCIVGRTNRPPPQHGDCSMPLRNIIGACALAACVIATPVAGAPFEEGKYPPFAGQWFRIGPLMVFDATKPRGRGQQAPLTAEYQAIYEANLADQAAGGFGDDPVYRCIPEGMPRAMTLVL